MAHLNIFINTSVIRKNGSYKSIIPHTYKSCLSYKKVNNQLSIWHFNLTTSKKLEINLCFDCDILGFGFSPKERFPYLINKYREGIIKPQKYNLLHLCSKSENIAYLKANTDYSFFFIELINKDKWLSFFSYTSKKIFSIHKDRSTITDCAIFLDQINFFPPVRFLNPYNSTCLLKEIYIEIQKKELLSCALEKKKKHCNNNSFF